MNNYVKIDESHSLLLLGLVNMKSVKKPTLQHFSQWIAHSVLQLMNRTACALLEELLCLDPTAGVERCK